MKKYFRISITESYIFTNDVVMLAALSNGNTEKEISLTDLYDVIRNTKLTYPHATDNLSVTLDDTFLSIDRNGRNILFIEEFQVI